MHNYGAICTETHFSEHFSTVNMPICKIAHPLKNRSRPQGYSGSCLLRNRAPCQSLRLQEIQTDFVLTGPNSTYSGSYMWPGDLSAGWLLWSLRSNELKEGPHVWSEVWMRKRKDRQEKEQQITSYLTLPMSCSQTGFNTKSWGWVRRKNWIITETRQVSRKHGDTDLTLCLFWKGRSQETVPFVC